MTLTNHPHDPPRRALPDEQGYHRRTQGPVLIREHPELIAAARKAIAARMGVPVGAITVDWERVRAPRVVRIGARRAA